MPGFRLFGLSGLAAHAVFAAVLGLASCQGCRTGSATSALDRAVPVEAPTVRLVLLTDLAGALEPCGCTKDQLGGLDHFGAWVRGQLEPVAPTFVVEAGPLFFMDPKLAGDGQDQDRAKAETIARVLRTLRFAAFAPGDNDWAAGAPALKSLVNESGGALLRGPGAAGPEFPSAERVVMKSVETPHGALRLAFLGVGQPQPGASLEAPERAIAQGIDEAKAAGANVLIALAAVGRGEAKRLADAHPELAAIVVGSARSSGDGNSSAPPGERIERVVIAQAANHLQTAVLLDLYVREPIAPGKLLTLGDATGLEGGAPAGAASGPPKEGSFFRYSQQEIRGALGNDPTIDADFLAYYKSVNDHNREALAGLLPRPATDGQASYVGTAACAGCHAAPSQVWDGTAHAHAYATLASQSKEYNLDCVGCHVTGYEKPGGSTVTHVNGLQNVGCEVCHGPGSRHVADPTASSMTRAPAPQLCLECHHPPHVEGFDPVAKTKAILGPGHGLPLKAER